jgi:methyltransferase FkbM-like protein
MHDAFIRLVAKNLREERFALIDLGCSGGIEPIWRLFGDRFAAIGFDASASECRRLVAEETSANVHYISGFVGIAPDHPFARHAEGLPLFDNNFLLRTSAAWSLELRAKSLADASDREKMQHNVWMDTELADANKPVFVSETLAKFGFESVDFLKIDIDGPDFQVLNSLDGAFEKLGILGVRLEVNMFGGAGDTTHTFHNTDRFMRQQGYVLAHLDNRSYSMRALPSRFAITMPGQSVRGRIYQAEAFYARDLAADQWKPLADSMSTEKLAKLAAIFSAWEQPDGAAELLLKFRDRLSALFDVDEALDMLAAQVQFADGDKDEVEILSYRDYMSLFESKPAEFYPSEEVPVIPKPALRDRVVAAWTALCDITYIHQLKQYRARQRMLDEKRKARAARRQDG